MKLIHRIDYLSEREAAAIRCNAFAGGQWRENIADMMIEFRDSSGWVAVARRDVIRFMEDWRRCGAWSLHGREGRSMNDDDRPALEILDDARGIAAHRRDASERGPRIRVEFAAQVAEGAGLHRLHDPAAKSGEFLDGYVQGYERAAELIRQLGEIEFRPDEA